MKFLLKKIRIITYVFNLLVAIGIFAYYAITSTSSRILIIHLTQSYALYAVFLLYIALLASPLYAAFPRVPLRTLHITARKAIGNSAFLLGLLHASIAFFGQLGGFEGLFYLNDKYLTAITLSFIALLILSIMFTTSFSYFITRLGKYWKPLHRFVYIATFFILIHSLMLGTHFSNLNGLIPQIFVYALTVLLILEAFRLDLFMSKRFHAPRFILFTVSSCIVAVAAYQLIFQATQYSALSIHSQHTSLLGQVAQNGQFTVSLLDAQVIEPGKPVTLRFQIYDNNANKPLRDFALNYTKIIHMIIVDNSLTYFAHLHPIKTGTDFSITTSFPKKDLYHVYFNYQPIGYQEQVSGINIQVGNTAPSTGNRNPDASLTKIFGNTTVSLKSTGGFKASNMNAALETLQFTISDTKTHKPVTDLAPYLGAYGHLVMINQDTYNYIHVHPNGLIPASPNERSGPNVSFIPLAIGTRITPGIYRIFAQFSRNGKLFTADFTVRINP